MKLTDILPVEIWGTIEREANKKFGLNASVFDVGGMRITGQNGLSNLLCREIRKSADGRTEICARSHQNISGQARRDRKTVIGECDAGLVKIAVPIFVNDEYLGSFGGCGMPLEGEEIDAFYISRVTGIPEEEVEGLGRDMGVLSRARSEEIADFLAAKVREVFEAASL